MTVSSIVNSVIFKKSVHLGVLKLWAEDCGSSISDCDPWGTHVFLEAVSLVVEIHVSILTGVFLDILKIKLYQLTVGFWLLERESEREGRF